MKLSQLAQVVFIGVAALFVYAFVTSARDAEARRVCTPLCVARPSYAAQNRRAPDFELPTMNGGKKRLSDYRGKVVILNFWTKTCRPCLEEMPSLADLAGMLKKRKGIELVTICTDESAEDARATLRSVLSGNDAPFEVLIDPESSVVADKFGTKLFPETWFIDPDGVIRARFDGARNWSDALNIDLAESLRGGNTCKIEFSRGQASGDNRALCDEFAPAG